MQQHVAPSDLNKVVSLDTGRTPFQRHQTAPIVRVHLIGNVMRASTFRGVDILPRGRKARAVLALLCLANGERVSRAWLAGLLWDRVPEYQARASFRQAYRELVVAFGPLADELITANRDTIRLDTSVCWIDGLAVFTAEKSKRGELAELCKGELLGDLSGVSTTFDQWLLGERSRFTERMRKMFEAELTSSTDEGPATREQIARRMIGHDPTHEGAYRILMRALADRQERVLALQEYEKCKEALQSALGIDPSPETRALYEAIRMYSNAREAHPPERFEKPKLNAFGEPERKSSNPRIGVIPLRALDTSTDEKICFELAMEIAVALERFRWFDIILPTLLGRVPSPSFWGEDVARRQDLDYIIEGTVTRVGGTHQITVRLLSLKEDTKPIWSQLFTLPVDRLDLLDELVTKEVVRAIDPVILHIEGSDAGRENGAVGCVLRAVPLIYSMESKKYEEAGELLRRARELEPKNAMVLAWSAYWNVYYVGQGWAKDPQAAKDIAREYAREAVALDPRNAEALAIYAHIMAFLHKEVDVALELFDRAQKLNSNLPFISAFRAVTHCYLGEHENALALLEKSRRHTAFQPYLAVYENPFAMAYLIKGDYENAVKYGRRVVNDCPYYSNGYKPLIAALGHLGQREEAARYVKGLLAVEQGFTLKRFAEGYPMKNEADREHYIEGLRLAGIPEG